MADLNGFHHVALTIRDLDTSLGWYTDVLGFELLFREEGDDRRAAVLKFRSGAFGVGLVEHRPTDDECFDARRPGLDHVAFSVGSQRELDQWAARLTQSGVDHSGAIDVPPGAILNFKDPDGIALSLFWDRP